jgi:hypothetical protein
MKNKNIITLSLVVIFAFFALSNTSLAKNESNNTLTPAITAAAVVMHKKGPISGYARCAWVNKFHKCRNGWKSGHCRSEFSWYHVATKC